MIDRTKKLLEQIEFLHTLVTGSCEIYDPDRETEREAVEFLRSRLSRWEPSVNSLHQPFDDAVKHLLTTALHEYEKYGVNT